MELEILANSFMNLDKLLKHTGLIKSYLSEKTLNRERKLLIIILISLGMYNAQIVYYIINILGIISSK